MKNLFDIADESDAGRRPGQRSNPPARRDASLVERMRAAGAVLVGALNMDEHAYGFTTENTHYGPCRNPHDPSRIAGGFVGSSAAAVAGGTRCRWPWDRTRTGSIRAGLACGVFGLKPTYGRLSRTARFLSSAA